jgi:hypothetical protein
MLSYEKALDAASLTDLEHKFHFEMAGSSFQGGNYHSTLSASAEMIANIYGKNYDNVLLELNRIFTELEPFLNDNWREFVRGELNFNREDFGLEG